MSAEPATIDTPGGTTLAASPASIKATSSIALAILFAVYFFSSVDRSIFGILAQPIKEELLLADWQLGFLTGLAFSAVQLLFGFPMARLADKGNRVSILSACVALWSVMTALCGLSMSFIQLSLFRMGVGVGEASCLPASHSLISDYFPPGSRTKALAIYGLGYPIGGLLGTIAGGIVLDHWGWRAAFYVVGLPGLLLALLTWRIVREPARGQFDAGDTADLAAPKSFREVALVLWRSPVLRQMILALTLLSIFTSPTSTFLGPYLIRRFPLSYTELGFIVAMTMMLGASLSTIGGGIIAQRLGRRDERWLLWFPAITVAVGMPLYVIALAQSDWLSLAIWMFFGALANATFLAPCYTVLYGIVAPGGRAKAAVIVQLFMGLIGLSFGPLLAGAANDMIAAMLFGPHAQGFLTACPGGQAAKGAPAALDAACRGAMVDATQIVLIATMALTIWPAWHFYLAGRRMKRAPR
ncbi:MAG TPA: MFS transporter [Sphingomonadaceae bacterium]|nr:MFS transporter [Sphingomonadaceae bacterium]